MTDAPVRPRRSVLYMPGAKTRALEKAAGLPADALILDLEDATGPTEKDLARDLVVEKVKAKAFGKREVIIRVNGLDTQWGEADVRAAAKAGPDAILVPKVSSPDDIAAVRAIMEEEGAPESTKIWAMMETPLGILNAQAIAQAPRLTCFIMGTNDLVKELNAAHTPDRAPVLASLSICLLAAKAYGLACIDGVYNAFKDDEGLRAECEKGLAMGFDGKTLIHPLQLAVTNEVFAPSQADLDLYARQVAAFEETRAKGEAVAVVDGKIVENLHVETAKARLALADAIKALEADLA
ncbi:HpcH/HpaI aldolase/citrate lyase family protein [Rhodovulum sp. DZ06]|uniref:HpcH/HpaI aldolase/citrate lyase family protein n=1 Tax=Rhodovulum sp. DZ06 TaxID=3425126 RepID=UPI003D32EDF1